MKEFPDSDSPSSTVLLESADSLPYNNREKSSSSSKRSVSKHNNNENFKAGYIPVHEQYLEKPDRKGRKTFAFWTLVFLLSILAVGNLIITLSILGVLRMGQGMQSLELIPDESTIKFFGDTDLDQLYKRDGRLEGFKDNPIEVDANDGGSIILKAIPKQRTSYNNNNKLIMNDTGTYFKNFQHFKISHEHDIAFTLWNPRFNIVSKMENFRSTIIEANRITSPIDRSLEITGRNKVQVQGSEGINVEGKEIIWTADQNIYLKSVNGSIIMSSNDGIFVDVKKIPLAKSKQQQQQQQQQQQRTTATSQHVINVQYKLCVCMPGGKLFRLPVPTNPNNKVYCNQVNWAEEHKLCI